MSGVMAFVTSIPFSMLEEIMLRSSARSPREFPDVSSEPVPPVRTFWEVTLLGSSTPSTVI
jgi:hypothetical protein